MSMLLEYCSFFKIDGELCQKRWELLQIKIGTAAILPPSACRKSIFRQADTRKGIASRVRGVDIDFGVCCLSSIRNRPHRRFSHVIS